MLEAHASRIPMPTERSIDEGPYGNRPATGAGTTTFGAVDSHAYRQPPTDTSDDDAAERAGGDEHAVSDEGASGSPGREASASTSGLRDGESSDFDATAGGTMSARAVSGTDASGDDAAGTDSDDDVAGTPNADRADEQRLRDPSGASTPESPGF